MAKRSKPSAPHSTTDSARTLFDEFAVELRDTAAGMGVFSVRAHPAGGVIGEIHGDVIDDPDYDSPHCMYIWDNIVMEPHAPFRFLNHSCDPNCEYDWPEEPENGGEQQVLLITFRDIDAGEQLTIDYHWPASAAIRCLCNSPNCRGWVVCEDELDELIW